MLQCSQGLGRANQGRVEPVQIVVLPTGKSLDVCAEMREAKKLRTPGAGHAGARRRRRKGRRRGKGNEGKGEEDQQKREDIDVFDFLNTKLASKGVYIHNYVAHHN